MIIFIYLVIYKPKFIKSFSF